MTQPVFEKFQNPPIKEAIFIINFSEEISLEKLSDFSKDEEVKKSYPIVKNLIQQSLTINRQKNSSATSFKNLQDGIILQTSEKKPEYILQAKKKAMSLHKVGNYKSWEELIAELKKVLGCFNRKLNSDIEIKDIGVRYINHIPISLNQPLEEYFRLLPVAVPGVPTNLNKFFLQLGVQEKELSGLIIESIVPVESTLNFIIDLRVTKKMGGVKINGESVWAGLNEIRGFKNQLFFSIITDKIKPLFK